MVPVARMLSSAAQGALSACIVLPATLLVHAPGVEVRVAEHWWIICTVIPLSAVTMASLGLLVGASVQPRSMGVVVGFLYLPMVFLGGVYYRWTSLSAIRVGDFPWLQALTLINPLTYVAEGMRAAYTDTAHMPLYVVYPGLVLFAAVLLGLGIHSFRQRVLS
ncbi:hypothetical protein EBF04_29625 [Streptomyces sp. I6]|nr:ABC transporter permease [Streptomyces sp. I6]RNL73900.1 hypothetical protein EBF04_29625 [Streptomyces sp. I6]